MATLRSLLDEYGFVIINSVISPEEADKTASEIWTHLRKLTQDDMSQLWTMGAKGIIQQYKIAHIQPVWDLRSHEAVHRVFKELWETEKLLVSFDGINVQLPPETTGKYADPYGRDWWHCDQGPKKLGFQSVQGFVNLEETESEDGCFTCIPGSHKYHEELFKAFPGVFTDDWVRLAEVQKRWYMDKDLVPVRVPCPKGGMVLWDSRTIHANSTALKGRSHPERKRMVVYTCMTPASRITPAELRKKQKYFYEGRVTNHYPSGFHVFPKVPQLYGQVAKYRPTLDRAEKIFTLPTLTSLGRKLAGLDPWP